MTTPLSDSIDSASVGSSILSPQDQSGNLKPSGKGHLAGRVRSGCWTCKARKKKCDERYGYPEDCCEACSRLGLVCKRAPLKEVPPRPSRRKDAQGAVVNRYQPQETTTIERPRKFGSILPGKPSSERMFMKYYVEKLAPLCSVVPGANNGYRATLLPMAIYDPSLLYSLLTFSASHMEVTTEVPLAYEQSRLEFEGKAAQGLSEAITLNDISDTSIACALVCCSADLTSGMTERWSLHLRGAAQLIRQRGEAELRETTDGLFLLRNFAYHDILAALSTGSRPIIPGVYWERSGYTCTDSVMGLTHNLFKFISEICELVAESKESTSEQSNLDLVSRGTALLHKVQNLELPTPTSYDSFPLLCYHAEAHRAAALLHLSRFIGRFSPSYLSAVPDYVESILENVVSVPESIYAEGGLVFPLFMAGIATSDEIEQRYIISRLGSIYNRLKFNNISKMCEVLAMLHTRGSSDWEGLIEELGWKLFLA